MLRPIGMLIVLGGLLTASSGTLPALAGGASEQPPATETPAAPPADPPAEAPDATTTPAPESAPLAPMVKQVPLSEKQITSFIAAQKDLTAITSKVQAAGDKPDPALQGELEDIAKKHGFQSFAELDDVAANISVVMAGLDPESGDYVDPNTALQKELADVQADSSIPDADKKQLVDDLTAAIKTTPPLENKGNIDLVKARRAEIEKALQ